MKMKMPSAIAGIPLLCVPGLTLMAISYCFGVDVSPFIAMIAWMSMMLGYEIIVQLGGKEYLWKIISNSYRNKMVFSICLVFFWTSTSIPIYLKIKSWWLTSVFILLGFLMAALVFKILASRSMKEDFNKKPNRIE